MDIIETPIGHLEIDYDDRSVRVKLKQTAHGTIMHDMDTDGRCHSSFFLLQKRLPTLFEEVTQNGHTFEVMGVRLTENGKVQVKNEQGVWEDWVG